MPDIPALIVGQGLAGTALAWHLLWRNRRLRIIDRGDMVTASRIAAGLITPITGKRLAVDEHFDAYFQAASNFYRRVEAETGCMFFTQPGAVRILRDDAERQRFERRRDRELRGRIAEAVPDPAFRASLGCFGIPQAARLDVTTYLEASRRNFADRGLFQSLRFEDCDVGASCVIHCTGIAAFREGTLPAEHFQPAKGEILTLRIPGLNEDRIINRGVWIARIDPDLFRAGATYSWDDLNDSPTAAGREQLVRRLQEFLSLPFEVVGHHAATRPITVDRQPIIRETAPGVWAFNGLASKGALLAPVFAERLAGLLK